MAGVVHASHTLKGSGLSIGLKGIASVCEAMEQASRGGDLGACRARLADLDEAYRLAGEEVNSLVWSKAA